MTACSIKANFCIQLTKHLLNCLTAESPAFLAAYHEMGFLWYEDPLPTTDIYNYSKLLEKMDIPVMATEFPAGWLDDYAPWITSKATDTLRGDVMIKGGITSMLKIAHLA